MSSYQLFSSDAVKYLQRLMEDHGDIDTLSLIVGLKPPLKVDDGRDILILSRHEKTAAEIGRDIDQAVRFVRVHLDALSYTTGATSGEETKTAGQPRSQSENQPDPQQSETNPEDAT